MNPTTELENQLYDTLTQVRDYMTQRKMTVTDYLEVMANIMGALKLYENKKYGTHIR